MRISFLLIQLFIANLTFGQTINRDSLILAQKEEREEGQLMDQEKFLRSEITKHKENLKKNPNHIRYSSFTINESSFYAFTPEQRKSLFPIRWILYRV